MVWEEPQALGLSPWFLPEFSRTHIFCKIQTRKTIRASGRWGKRWVRRTSPILVAVGLLPAWLPPGSRPRPQTSVRENTEEASLAGVECDVLCTCSLGDRGSIPGLGWSLGGWHGYHSSTLAWRILWTEEPGGLQSTGSLRVGQDWGTSTFTFVFGLLQFVQWWHNVLRNGYLFIKYACFSFCIQYLMIPLSWSWEPGSVVCDFC